MNTDLAAKHAKLAKELFICRRRVRRAHRLSGMNILLLSEYCDDEGEVLRASGRAGERILARFLCWFIHASIPIYISSFSQYFPNMRNERANIIEKYEGFEVLISPSYVPNSH